MRDYIIGEEVLDIYSFMSNFLRTGHFLRPEQGDRNYIHKVKSINNKYFSIYDMETLDFEATMNDNKRTKRDADISFEKIISTLQVTPYRKSIYLRLNEDKEIIKKCKEYLFQKEYEKNKLQEDEKISRLQNEIEQIKEKGINGSKDFMAERESSYNEIL